MSPEPPPPPAAAGQLSFTPALFSCPLPGKQLGSYSTPCCCRFASCAGKGVKLVVPNFGLTLLATAPLHKIRTCHPPAFEKYYRCIGVAVRQTAGVVHAFNRYSHHLSQRSQDLFCLKLGSQQVLGWSWMRSLLKWGSSAQCTILRLR